MNVDVNIIADIFQTRCPIALCGYNCISTYCFLLEFFTVFCCCLFILGFVAMANRDDVIIPLLMIMSNAIVVISTRPPSFPDDDMLMNILSILNLMTLILSTALPPTLTQALLPLHERILPAMYDADEQWTGRDVFTVLSEHRQTFWLLTSETPETFNAMYLTVLPRMQTGYKLSVRNRLLMTLIWLRQYPTYVMLSGMFTVCQATCFNIVESTWMLLWEQYAPQVNWHSEETWATLVGTWPKMPNVVGAIDGTSHEILIPGVQQQLYYSGHRKFHCLHTQVNLNLHLKIRKL